MPSPPPHPAPAVWAGSPVPRTAASRRIWLGMALGVAASPALAQRRRRTAPARASYPIAPGRSFWLPEVSPTGPVVAAVNLHTQHTQLFRNGLAIGYSSVSTGKPGHGTPTGLFTVLEKRRHHRSNLYSNAPMPWMVRLTWGGIAFHGGALPGYPASHGCIRLPMNFAPRLFGALAHGSAVAVLRQPPSPGQTALPLLAPIDPQGQPLLRPEMLAPAPYWADELSASASWPASAAAPVGAQAGAEPLTLIASLPQRRLFAMQQGRVLAAAPLPPMASAQALGDQRLFLWSEEGRWHAMGQATTSDTPLWSSLLPSTAGFAQRLRALLRPGSTLLVSDMAAVGDWHVAAWRL